MENNPLLKEQSVNHNPNMEMQQGGKQKNMYVLSLDGSRIFWILSIVLLLMTFVLLLGYWIGSDAAMSSMNNKIAMTNKNNTVITKPETNKANDNTKAVIQKEEINKTNTPEPKTETVNTENQKNSAPKTNNSKPEENVKFSRGEETVFNPDTGKVSVTDSKNSTRQRISRKLKRLKTRRGIDTLGRDKYMTRSKPYSIQIATHFSLRSAMHVKRRLRRKNHSAYIFMHKSSSGRKFYKIRVGTFSTRTGAKTYLSRLRRSRYGRGAIIIHR